MSNLSVFSFESHEIRFVGTADDPWWIAQDLCAVLDIQNIRQNLAKLDDDEKGVCTISTKGGNQELATVNESAMYQLILSSRKPQAKKFRKWITSEVIPAIRKTGTYSTQSKRSPISNTKLVELTDRQNTLRQQIKDIEIALNAKRYELQEVTEVLVVEAQAYKSANSDAVKCALLCDDILKRAKQANPYLSLK